MDKDKSKWEFLYDLYYDEKSPGSYASIYSLFRECRKLGRKDIKFNDVRKFLNQQEVHSIFSKVHRKKNKPILRSFSLHYLAEGDIAHMNKADKKQNNNYSFFLLVVNVLSLKTYCQPLRSVKSQEVSKALRKIFRSCKVSHFRTDGGGEFQGESKIVYHDYNIKHYTNLTGVHAPLAEVRIKVVKARLHKAMYANNTQNWVQFLPGVVGSLNDSGSRMLNWHSPNEVEQNMSSAELYQLRYHNRYKAENKKKEKKSCLEKYKSYKKEFKFDLGSVVRLTKVRHAFFREYTISNTHQLYLVSSRKKMDEISMYTVKSFSGEDLSGFFYDDELVLVCEPLKRYKIKRILDSKIDESGEKYYKVTWQGYETSESTWLSQSDMGEVSFLN